MSTRRSFIETVMSAIAVMVSYPTIAFSTARLAGKFTEKDLLPLELPEGVHDAAIYDGMREIRQYYISGFDDGFMLRWDIMTTDGHYTLVVKQTSDGHWKGGGPHSEERVTLRNMARQKLYAKAGVTSTKSIV